jgi:nucleoside-diphosphate-sugar epimerase
MRVLLTGGSGFIASHILQQLLEAGHSVVTTVRSTDKAEAIKSAYPNTPSSQLDFAIIEDVARDNAFDSAVVSDPPFEAVLHTASPFHFNVTDIQKDLLDPAIKGTTGILQSIVAYAPSVKRVVVTSSWASVVNPFKGSWPDHTYTEHDWNPITSTQALESIPNGYRASKTFAEQTAWKFMKEKRPDFALTTLCPPQVLGPVIGGTLNSLDKLNTSNQIVRDFMLGKFTTEVPDNTTFYWIDVRDVSRCHVEALVRDQASNQRYIVTAGRFSNREVVDIVRGMGQEYAGKLPPENAPGGAYPEEGLYDVDASKVVKDLGVSWKSLDRSIVDTVNSLQRLL